MPDSVQPIRHAAAAVPTSGRDGRGKNTPFTLNDEPPPEPQTADDSSESAQKARQREHDIGHKPDDEEGATLDVTG